MKKLFKKSLVLSMMVIMFAIAINIFAATVGESLPEKEAGWERYDDDNVNFKYGGTWTRSPYSGCYGSKYNYTTDNVNGYFMFSFYGDKFRLIGQLHPNRTNKANIVIDNNISESFQQYRPTTIEQGIMYEKTGLEYKKHTVKVTFEDQQLFIDALDINESGKIVPIEYTNLTATANIIEKSIVLNWDKVDVATGYNVKRSTVASGPYETIANNVTENTYTDSNTTVGITYYYVVAPIVNDKEGTPSNEAPTTIPLEPTGNTTLDILASAEKVKVGQEFTTDVILKNASNIYAEDFKVNYNNTLFEYVGCEQVAGYKLYNTPEDNNGTLRFIIASQGKNYVINNDTTILKLKFKAKAVGTGKVDALKARIADTDKEYDIEDVNCLEDTIIVEGGQDVNRTGEYTLLDLSLDGYYYGMNTADTDTTKYDADQDLNGKIEDVDLTIVVDQMLKNTNYTPNI